MGRPTSGTTSLTAQNISRFLTTSFCCLLNTGTIVLPFSVQRDQKNGTIKLWSSQGNIYKLKMVELSARPKTNLEQYCRKHGPQTEIYKIFMALFTKLERA